MRADEAFAHFNGVVLAAADSHQPVRRCVVCGADDDVDERGVCADCDQLGLEDDEQDSVYKGDRDERVWNE